MRFCETSCIRPRADPEDDSDWPTCSAVAAVGPVQVGVTSVSFRLCAFVSVLVFAGISAFVSVLFLFCYCTP